MKKKNLTMRMQTALSGLLLGCMLATPAVAGKLQLPDWNDLFNSDGTLKDVSTLLGVPDAADYGYGAMFVEDNISNGEALDMSALMYGSSYDQSVVYNGTIDAAHDLGNLYVYGEASAKGTMYFAGVERLAGSGNSYVEFEFNQATISVFSVDSAIQGERMDGDALVRTNLSGGKISSVEFYRWQANADGSGDFVLMKSATAKGRGSCLSQKDKYLICSGDVVTGLAPTNSDVWDSAGQPVVATPADSFLEMGLNLDWLSSNGADFTSLVVKTPQDIVFSYLQGQYRDIAYWR